MGLETPKVPAPEEMAKINRERTQTEGKLEAAGADIKYNQKGEAVDINPTAGQLENMHIEMEVHIDAKKRLREKKLELVEKIDTLPGNESALFKVFDAINKAEDYAKDVEKQNKNNEAFIELAQRNYKLREILWKFTDRLPEIGPAKGLELDKLSLERIDLEKEEKEQ